MNYKKLFVSIVLPQAAGIIGSLFTAPAIAGWYGGLQKPTFSPPNWLFGPVWVTLYLMMGVSVYLIWTFYGKAPEERKKEIKTALALFWIHLFFNAIWSIIFFGMQNIGLALADIVILWLFIIVLIVKFWKLDKRAAYLLLPYLAWVSLASVLNFYLWKLN